MRVILLPVAAVVALILSYELMGGSPSRPVPAKPADVAASSGVEASGEEGLRIQECPNLVVEVADSGTRTSESSLCEELARENEALAQRIKALLVEQLDLERQVNELEKRSHALLCELWRTQLSPADTPLGKLIVMPEYQNLTADEQNAVRAMVQHSYPVELTGAEVVWLGTHYTTLPERDVIAYLEPHRLLREIPEWFLNSETQKELSSEDFAFLTGAPVPAE